ncbi:sulfate reduction electron transfer complex DsrMKJOP subunit DsrK [Fundidesulfovibrio agrisoli]|uniref:sulfate reduction electron transfer complex DsrMKJOP subunit DsrK n=1 Tax=Fundidesulfovibrio agrisoli TaxID=2922717 RepID=UPI001FADE1CF|nr:(Fe-S)-binding protein [Fundidesulfovibrio agrisoli]
MSKMAPPEEVMKVDYSTPAESWMDVKPEFKLGNYSYPGKPDVLKYLGLPNPREWNPVEEDWKLPPDWREIVRDGFRELLKKYRSLKVFMDVCVRCGACADKCHFYIGSGDPKNMPVLRAELLRSIYRGEFTVAAKILGKLSGSRKLEEDVIKEWFMYFYQCTQCRRCSLYCPYGIDTAEITFLARDLMNRIGVNINWILEPVANCNRTGNHLGIQPHAFKDMMDFLVDDIETITGRRVEPTFHRKGAEILFITPSGDIFAEPGIYTFMGYLLLFDYLDLDVTWSTYASEGGNFGSFTNDKWMKKLNAKMYHEAKRLGVKYIIGGECGHMWRVLNQFMDTMNGPADFLEVPKSPITGTVFNNAKSTKMIHLVEFTADLIKNGKLKLDKSRNAGITATWHDSCNTSRGMGFFDEPRYVLENVVEKFVDMPAQTIREQTFCCGGGAGLNNGEFTEMRLRGGLPRGNALRYVQEKFGVNTMSCICAIDRATLPGLADYWAPGVKVTGLHELVGNALVFEGEEERTMNLRQEDLPGVEGSEEDE